MPQEFNLDDWVLGEPKIIQLPLLKITEGKHLIRILDGVPTKRFIHELMPKRQPVVCSGSGCLFCANRIGRRWFWYFEVFDHLSMKNLVVKVLGSSKLGKEVARVGKEYGDPTTYDVWLTRVGRTNDTTYTITPYPSLKTATAVRLPKRFDIEAELERATMLPAEQRAYFKKHGSRPKEKP